MEYHAENARWKLKEGFSERNLWVRYCQGVKVKMKDYAEDIR